MNGSAMTWLDWLVIAGLVALPVGALWLYVEITTWRDRRARGLLPLASARRGVLNEEELDRARERLRGSQW